MSISPQTQSIPLKSLVRSKTNVRRTARDRGIDALMASIAAHGLRQNLNVKPISGGRFEVVAGGRRLEALKRLMKSGALPDDFVVPCAIVANDDNAAEISLAENTLREAMHPDDQCTAFAALIEGGMGVEDIAARFGITPAVVRQRLKLASVSPALRARFRKEEIDLAQMMALALVDDHEAQERAWDELPDWNRDPDTIRRALTEEGLPVSHRLARFVGIDAYEAVGGVVLRDLFDEEQDAVLTNAALVEQLAMRRIEEEAAHVQAEGWQWVATALQADYTTAYGRVYPHETDDARPIYAPEDLVRAGARLFVDHAGELRIERGLIDPKTVQAERRAQSGESPSSLYPETLIQSLTAHRTASLRLELSRNPHLALAATVHALGLDLLYEAYGIASCLDLHVSHRALEPLAGDVTECAAHAALDQAIAAMMETLPGDPAQFWEWCIAQDQTTLLDVLALIASLSLDAVTRRPRDAQEARIDHADVVAAQLGLDMHTNWQPRGDGFFMRLSKSAMGTLLTDADEPQQAAVISKVKKVEAAQRTAATLLAKGWLPAPLAS
jgi:ParB family chromosome partitioning protein